MSVQTPELSPQQRRKTNLFIFLAAIFLTNAILAEMIGVKIFSLEKALGIAPAQLHLLDDFVLDFNLTAGVVIWPFVFVTSDLINEYFGKAGVRRISFMAAGFIAYAFLAIFLVTLLPPADFWLAVNKNAGGETNFNVDLAFSTIFRQGLGIIIGSLVAFLVGQLLDAYVFQWVKKLTGGRYIWLRATGSTLISQLIDSFLVLYIAFVVFGNWSIGQMLSVGTINYIYKGVVALAMTPVLYLAHYLIDNFLAAKKGEL